MLGARELTALVIAMRRHMLWGHAATKREIGRWRARAATIPDAPMRQSATRSLAAKKSNWVGAGFFCTLAATQNLDVLRLLVAYQVMWDYLDTETEATSTTGQRDALALHLALADSLRPAALSSDYYRFHSSSDDGGYLPDLVATCKRICPLLPSYPLIETRVAADIGLCSAQAINHDADCARREASLRKLAASLHPLPSDLSWFERTAAASAFLPHPLLALAAHPDCTGQDVASISAAYFPWMSLAITMLDSYVDCAADIDGGDHSYVSYYRCLESASHRLTEIIKELESHMRALPNGERHAVIASAMVAINLSQSAADAPPMRLATRQMVRECTTLTKLVVRLTRAKRRSSRLLAQGVPFAS